VYVRSGTTWTQQQRLVQSGVPIDQGFGYYVAISGDTVLVGAPDRDTGTADPGAAYVFVRSGGVWTQEQRIQAGDQSPHDRFGRCLSIAGDTAVISSPLDDDRGQDAGAVYVFTRTGSTWSQLRKITAIDGGEGDKFGLFVAQSGDTAVTGGPLHKYPDQDAGSSYVLENLTGASVALPPPSVVVNSFLLPTKISTKTVGATGAGTLAVAGVIDTGAISMDLSSAARLDIGSLDIVIPGLVRRRKSLVYSGNGVKFTLTPGARGSSRAAFRLKFTGLLADKIPLNGPVTVHFRGATADCTAIVHMTDGAFALGRTRGSVAQPSLFVVRAGAKLRGAGADSITMSVGFATDGVAPALAPDVAIGFGTFAVTLPGTSFTRSGDIFLFSGNLGGITAVSLDYGTGIVAVKGKGVTLGSYAPGGNEVQVTVDVGTDTRGVRVRVGRAGSNLTY
jgi:hypothetical protein